MPSQSNQQKPTKLKLVFNTKQQWHVKQQKRNWLELPSDVMASILNRVGVYDILENAQKVCTTWHKICKDPAMWRVICMDKMFSDPDARRPRLREMCKHAVDRSQGQLVDITVCDFANEELLEYIADSCIIDFKTSHWMMLIFIALHGSSQLRRLEFVYCYEVYENWAESLEKFPLLEELSLYIANISKEVIETAGRCCPMLTTLKINYDVFDRSGDGIAIAIGASLPQLKHLELIGHFMSNTGLQAILDGCRHLELLDLRHCHHTNLEGELGKKCKEKIKCLKLPNESIEDCPYIDKEDPIAGPAIRG